MSSPSLQDLFLTLFDEAELRAWFDARDLGAKLPGRGVSFEELCHQGEGVLTRRGEIDAALFEDLAARAGRHLPLVEAVAKGYGLALKRPRTRRADREGAARPKRSADGGDSAAADLSEDPKVRDLRALIEKRQVVVIVGSGVSLAATGGAKTAGWKGLLQAGVEHCKVFARAEEKWCRRQLYLLDDGEVADWIHVAQQITSKLGGPKGGEFRGWLRASFETLKAQDTRLLQAIADLGCLLATTNYDHLLEEVTGLPAVSWDEDHKVDRLIRGDRRGVLHLHGHWDRPESVVLGVESYLSARDDGHARAVREALRTRYSLLFIGCGDTTEDPNLGAWLEWSAQVFAGSEYRNYRLDLNEDVARVQAKHDTAQRLFAVGYGPKHSDLPDFVRRLAPRAPDAEGD